VIAAAAAAGGRRSEERRRDAFPSPSVVEAARARADRAASGLTADLFSELSRALAQDAPERAVDLCGRIAQRLTAQAAGREDVAVRRTSLQVRNPVNAPDDYERRVLQTWARPGARPAPSAEVVARPGGGYELRYLRPIILQPSCVTCHGGPGQIPAAVRATIHERYPDDQAVGFRPGDVRGAVSVRVPLEGP
jgi:hypothetical protein